MPDTARNKTVAQLALWSIPVALGIMAIKFAAWRLTGSVALFSDALESIINVLAALMAYSAIRISQIPPDKNHPFGHYKAEYFSAVAEGVLIVLAAFMILREAIPALVTPNVIEAPLLGLSVNGLAAIANAAWAYLLIRRGREHHSPALSADGAHIMTDVYTSIGVILGLLLALATGLTILDPILAILMALNILRTGWNMIRASVDVLMDGAVEPKEAERIEAAILANAKGANEIHDVRTRRAGPALFIEFHLVVDGQMSVTDSHAICDRIEAALEKLAPRAHVTIHVEPAFKSEKDARQISRS